MRKKIGTLLIIGSFGALCAGLAACSNDSEYDRYFKNGNVISITYDANGGSIAGGTKLIDMFNPEKYTADENGEIKIKLRTPTDINRPKPGADNVTVENGENSLVGWYKTREVGAYGEYVYSDPWDFEEDRVVFNKNEQDKLEMTLYAAWIPQYTFEYYTENEKGDWEKYGTTSFNYLISSDEAKTVYLPQWGDSGKMEHTHNSFTFPSVTNKTFKAAYSDESCTTPITEKLIHHGTLDLETAKAEDTVHKIYVKFDEGNHYRISTATQFRNIGDLSGHYEIMNDLDFTGVGWSNGFSLGEFSGTIEGDSTSPIIFKNVNATYNLTGGASQGGLFGRVGENAKITNVTFENATLSYKSAVNNRGGNFGFFAGEIDDGATVQNVTLSGELRLWQMRISGGNGFNFNLTANGDQRSEITDAGIVIKVCGNEVTFGRYEGMYEYDIDPNSESFKVDGDGKIEFMRLEDSNQDEIRAKRMKEKEYFVVYGGQEDE